MWLSQTTFLKKNSPSAGQLPNTSPIMQCLYSCAHRPFSDHPSKTGGCSVSNSGNVPLCALGLRAEVIVSTEEVEENVLKKRLPAEADSDWRTTLVLFPHTEKFDSPGSTEKPHCQWNIWYLDIVIETIITYPWFQSKTARMWLSISKVSLANLPALYVQIFDPKRWQRKAILPNSYQEPFKNFGSPKVAINFAKVHGYTQKSTGFPRCLQDLPRP